MFPESPLCFLIFFFLDLMYANDDLQNLKNVTKMKKGKLT